MYIIDHGLISLRHKELSKQSIKRDHSPVGNLARDRHGVHQAGNAAGSCWCWGLSTCY
jgi:hypothetical protein